MRPVLVLPVPGACTVHWYRGIVGVKSGTAKCMSANRINMWPRLFHSATIDGLAFLAYISTHLAPTLQKGDVVIMNNLATNKMAAAREAISDRSA